GGLARLGEDLGHGLARVGLDLGVAVEVGPAQARRQQAPHRGLAHAHHADDEDHRSPSPARKAERLRANSSTESPPNLRRASPARTSATMVSATTPMAGTAVTSV